MTFDQWVVLIPILFAQVTTTALAIINAFHTNAIAKQIEPPSNGHTLGALVESIHTTSGSAAIDAARVRNAVVGGGVVPPVPDPSLSPVPVVPPPPSS